jgi:NADH-quinone oxidoreductase subunit G
MERPQVERLHHFDDITRACAAEIPALAGITAAAPDHHFLNAGVKIPRQTHRYSGRTAMRADVSVHEPRQPCDEESPLAFTMEGLNRNQPGALLPYVWAPGWNSNQSLHKFQSSVGGPLKGGTTGARLLQAGGLNNAPALTLVKTPAAPAGTGQWQLVPRQRIFGSDELSALSPAIAELIETGFIEVCSADAATLGVSQGDGVEVSVVAGETAATLEVRINDSLAAGCAGYSAGLAGTLDLVALASAGLCRAANWQRRPEIIGSDGGAEARGVGSRDVGPGGAHV